MLSYKGGFNNSILKKGGLAMKSKILLYFTSVIFLIFSIIGSTIDGETSLQKINFEEVMFRSETISEKTKARIFGDSNQLQTINPRFEYNKLAINDIGKYPSPSLLQWKIEVGNKIFQIFVNRADETITIRGEADDWEEKDKVEHVIKLRAPTNFQIINEIDIHNIDIHNKEIG